MNRAAFQELLDRYGADLEGWPPKEVAAARKLLSEDPEARRFHAQSRRLETLLRQTFENGRSRRPADAVAVRILARLETLPGQGGPDREMPEPGTISVLDNGVPRWTRAAALTLAAALGIAIGYFGAGNQALQGRQRMTLAMDGMDSDLNAALFDTDTPAGAPR